MAFLTRSSLASTLFSTALIESMSSLRAPSCAHNSMALSCARDFKCGYIDTNNPNHDIDHGVPSHDYLDQGCNTHRSHLPRPRLQYPPLSATSTSAQGLSPRMSTPRLPLQSKQPRRNSVHDALAPNAGDVSPLVSMPSVYLQFDRRRGYSCSRHYPYNCGGCYRYCRLRIRIC
jgi:hypothetical protein